MVVWNTVSYFFLNALKYELQENNLNDSKHRTVVLKNTRVIHEYPSWINLEDAKKINSN